MDLSRVEVANQVLQFFAPDTHLTVVRGRVFVHWERHGGEKIRRQWMTRGNDFYPVWHHKWAHGGTCCTALSQLVRWIQERPVLPIATWQYWAGKTVFLGREQGPRMAEVLTEHGYPQVANCVLCKQPITGSLDWWNLDGVSGPCCSWTNGCRQKLTA